MLTKSRLSELFTYDQTFGLLFRKRGTGGRAKGTEAGYENEFGYVVLHVDNKEYRRSHLVWCFETGSLPTQEIDHINRIRNDDRFKNLREATRQQNRWNTTAKNIYWKPKAKKYEAKVNNKYLGRFSTFDDAKNAVQKATEYRGAFSAHH